jgi:DNA-binding response OmpR family regulator
MTKIMLIDDDPDLCILVSTILKKEGYDVEVAHSGREGIPKTKAFQPDLILLDVMIPGESGWEICEQLHQDSDTPVIFLSARGSENDIVRGLQLGADDYIAKPFRRHELIARIEAVLRRTQQVEGEVDTIYQIGDLVVNQTLWEVQRGQHPIHLTPTEFELLLLLVKNAGRPISHQDLLTKIWGAEQKENLNILKVYIRQLRTKVEPHPDKPRYILTKRGFGYYLSATP